MRDKTEDRRWEVRKSTQDTGMKEEGRNEDTMYGCGFCTCAIAQFELHVIAIVFQVLFLYVASHEEAVW